MYAANYGHTECVKNLVKSGANVNHADYFGRSSIMCGTVSGKVSVMSVLVQSGTKKFNNKN